MSEYTDAAVPDERLKAKDREVCTVYNPEHTIFLRSHAATTFFTGSFCVATI